MLTVAPGCNPLQLESKSEVVALRTEFLGANFCSHTSAFRCCKKQAAVVTGLHVYIIITYDKHYYAACPDGRAFAKAGARS